MTVAQAEEFVREALDTFRWHSEATVSLEDYKRLHDAHRLIADVVSFRGPHINHLTPRTLDIDAVQAGMPRRGIAPKAVIEGPPRARLPDPAAPDQFQGARRADPVQAGECRKGSRNAYRPLRRDRAARRCPHAQRPRALRPIARLRAAGRRDRARLRHRTDRAL